VRRRTQSPAYDRASYKISKVGITFGWSGGGGGENVHIQGGHGAMTAPSAAGGGEVMTKKIRAILKSRRRKARYTPLVVGYHNETRAT